jgi:hypothetical protein
MNAEDSIQGHSILTCKVLEGCPDCELELREDFGLGLTEEPEVRQEPEPEHGWFHLPIERGPQRYDPIPMEDDFDVHAQNRAMEALYVVCGVGIALLVTIFILLLP